MSGKKIIEGLKEAIRMEDYRRGYLAGFNAAKEMAAQIASGESGPYPSGKPIVGDETALAMQAVLHQVRNTISEAIRSLTPSAPEPSAEVTHVIVLPPGRLVP